MAGSAKLSVVVEIVRFFCSFVGMVSHWYHVYLFSGVSWCSVFSGYFCLESKQLVGERSP